LINYNEYVNVNTSYLEDVIDAMPGEIKPDWKTLNDLFLDIIG